jgi:hypothetical protein
LLLLGFLLFLLLLLLLLLLLFQCLVAPVDCATIVRSKMFVDRAPLIGACDSSTYSSIRVYIYIKRHITSAYRGTI